AEKHVRTSPRDLHGGRWGDAPIEDLLEEQRIDLQGFTDALEAAIERVSLTGWLRSVGVGQRHNRDLRWRTHPQLREGGDRVAVGVVLRFAEQRDETLFDIVAHHVLPPAGLVMHERPLEPDHVSEEAFGKSGLAHHLGGAPHALLRALQVPIARYNHEAITLRPRHRLRDRRTRVPEQFSNPGTHRRDALLDKYKHRLKVHLSGVDEIAHEPSP